MCFIFLHSVFSSLSPRDKWYQSLLVDRHFFASLVSRFILSFVLCVSLSLSLCMSLSLCISFLVRKQPSHFQYREFIYFSFVVVFRHNIKSFSYSPLTAQKIKIAMMQFNARQSQCMLIFVLHSNTNGNFEVNEQSEESTLPMIIFHVIFFCICWNVNTFLKLKFVLFIFSIFSVNFVVKFGINFSQQLQRTRVKCECENKFVTNIREIVSVLICISKYMSMWNIIQ